MPAETRTYDLAYVIAETGAPSEDWLRRKLNAGHISGRRAGRTWRMTESDMAALVEYMASPARPGSADARPVAESTPATGSTSTLTPRSRRVVRGRTA